MLIGYDKEGEIKFIFTDEKYLDKVYPRNTAKVSDFWKHEHGLKELSIPIAGWPDWDNYRNYKVVDGRLVLKDEKEKEKTMIENKNKISKQGLFVKKLEVVGRVNIK
jgi:hypothetical protein